MDYTIEQAAKLIAGKLFPDDGYNFTLKQREECEEKYREELARGSLAGALRLTNPHTKKPFDHKRLSPEFFPDDLLISSDSLYGWLVGIMGPDAEQIVSAPKRPGRAPDLSGIPPTLGGLPSATFNPPPKVYKLAIEKGLPVPQRIHEGAARLTPREPLAEHLPAARTPVSVTVEQLRATGAIDFATDWRIKAREIADELFDRDTDNKCRDSLDGYSKRVMAEMQKRDIRGPRGIIDNHGTVKREALQGAQWWKTKRK